MAAAKDTSTKEALRREARRLFARHGYDGVSMRDIAQAVGVQQSAIYNHFPSKQDLLVDLMERHMQTVLDRLRALQTRDLPPSNALEVVARFHVSYHIDQAEDVFLAYMELRSLEAEGRARILPLRRAYEAELLAILERGQADGFKIADPAVLTRALLAMLTGVTVWFREDGARSREEVAETYVQATLQAAGLTYTAEEAKK